MMSAEAALRRPASSCASGADRPSAGRAGESDAVVRCRWWGPS
ncbi:hypothetical protein HMPREF9062_1218 [Actinomyces sp. oral taxon 448 str. F0400]|nr:hypothetical protein HMPREF9062_1218 [Actinomyces sp. oral taxon 448 str. F0400]